MPYTEQYINSLYFSKLKNIKDVTIDFTESRLIAIMGVNGAGKSTILHALACCYKPLETFERINYRFSDFFIPSTFASWQNSSFEMDHKIRNKEVLNSRSKINYIKKDRWTPRYENRPERHIEYFGISSCVPAVEVEGSKSLIVLSSQRRNDQKSEKLIELASYVLDIKYTQVENHESKMGKKISRCSKRD